MISRVQREKFKAKPHKIAYLQVCHFGPIPEQHQNYNHFCSRFAEYLDGGFKAEGADCHFLSIFLAHLGKLWTAFSFVNQSENVGLMDVGSGDTPKWEFALKALNDQTNHITLCITTKDDNFRGVLRANFERVNCNVSKRVFQLWGMPIDLHGSAHTIEEPVRILLNESITFLKKWFIWFKYSTWPLS